MGEILLPGSSKRIQICMAMKLNSRREMIFHPQGLVALNSHLSCRI